MPNSPFILPKGIASADGVLSDASQTLLRTQDVGTSFTGGLLGATSSMEAFERLDNTGIGAAPRTFTGSFISSSGNIDQWYGGRQNVELIGASGQANGNYVYELPDPNELGLMFDDLALRGIGEIYTLTVGYLGGSTSSIVRNSMTIRAPSVSASFDRNEIPTTIGQGTSVTFRIERIGNIIGRWDRLGVQASGDPIATFGEVVLQNLGWNNQDFAGLPQAAQVQKGYAFPVIGSTPNDGALRQALQDESTVSDRVIYDGDYVVWTADTFTSWVNGDDWFVINRNSLQRMSQEQSNFLAQTAEVDNRVDVGLVNFMTNNALVWLSQSVLAEAPFLAPSTDTNNPRAGDDYAYIGGTEDVNGMGVFQFGQNRFNSFMTIGITPSFITGHDEEDIQVRIVDQDGVVLDDLNLATDFTFVDDTTFTNGTVRHYQRNSSVNYPFLAMIQIVLTQVQRHFMLNPNSVDVTANIANDGIVEQLLSPDVRTKLNANLTPDNSRFNEIEPRLMRYTNISNSTPEVNARFLNAGVTDTYPSAITSFTQVSAENPRFTGNDVALFVATPEPASFSLLNITTKSALALDQNEAAVDLLESVSDGGVTYFVYRVTGLTSGHIYEVERITTQQVIQERNDIKNLQSDVIRIDAELEHALLNLPDEVVQVLEHEVTVAEESTPTTIATDYNIGLGDTGSQTVFFEDTPQTPSGGVLNSDAINKSAASRLRNKLVYFPAGTNYVNQDYLTAFDGTSGRNLISYVNGVFNAKVFVPAIPASTVISTIYPAPATRVSGSGIWINIPALTFVNGGPVPESDEVFFTRNIPTSVTVLNIQYRGHANGNVFGLGSTTLAGVGGNVDQLTTVNINDGSESAAIEIRWYAAQRQIRVSVTEHVNVGLATINDVEVILSYDETRTVPATGISVREVELEHVSESGNVFAIKPSSTGDLILVGNNREVNTGYAYTTLFGASEDGNLIVPVITATYLDYQDLEVIPSTIVSLENHASLPQFGLFTTQYTRETLLNLGVTLKPQGLNVGDLPTSATGLLTGDLWNDSGVLKIV